MKKCTAFLIAILITFLIIPRFSAAADLPDVNEQPRHIVCTALSQQAQAYYTGTYSYDALSTLSGATDTTTGYTAMQDNALFTALHTLMADTHTYSCTYAGYKAGSLAYYWQRTDAVDSGDTYTMFYSDVSADAEGISLNREHIWPKSRASFVEKNGGSDLHHLRPAVDSLNRAKSNHMFGEIHNVYDAGYTTGTVLGEECYWVKADEDLFECKDDVKGDVARILLYVYCRWEQPNLYADLPAELLPDNEAGSENSGVRVIQDLDTLLRWCAEDPVDSWEMRRNDLVQDVQGNRNVFIDYPELAWQLFGKDQPDAMPTPSHPLPILGDADGDGEVTILDVTVIQRHLSMLTVNYLYETAADVDGDNSVTILDATLIQRMLAAMPSTVKSGLS